jgi:hypothetical protein
MVASPCTVLRMSSRLYVPLASVVNENLTVALKLRKLVTLQSVRPMGSRSLPALAQPGSVMFS